MLRGVTFSNVIFAFGRYFPISTESKVVKFCFPWILENITTLLSVDIGIYRHFDFHRYWKISMESKNDTGKCHSIKYVVGSIPSII